MRSCGDPLDEPVRPGADRPFRHPVAELARGLGRNHHAGAVGKLRQQRRIGLGKLEPHRHRVDDHGGLDRLELGHAARIRRRLVALDVELHRLGIERLAVVEQDAGAQLHRERVAIIRPRPFGRKLPARSGARASTSISLSHSAAITTRSTKLTLCAGSSVAGSACSPMRSVCAGAGDAKTRAAQMTARAQHGGTP